MPIFSKQKHRSRPFSATSPNLHDPSLKQNRFIPFHASSFSNITHWSFYLKKKTKSSSQVESFEDKRRLLCFREQSGGGWNELGANGEILESAASKQLLLYPDHGKPDTGLGQRPHLTVAINDRRFFFLFLFGQAALLSAGSRATDGEWG